ncbi:MAG: recombination mediator RecR [Alphaproteobacteria bacterium]|nr:recombination mediator RecR [Alphaproteobacteria bacterium]MDE6571540.1 recombination mediator RecR [Alphaproteobacteria bacterium]
MNPKIEKLIKQFAKLPRVGNRAAQRITLGLLQDKSGRAAALAAALNDAAESIAPCPVCGVLTDVGAGRCEFCRDAARANGQIAVVRDLADVWTLEKSAVFRGRYHILGGQLSGVAGVTPDDLNIASLPGRVADENITEIIFALPNTVEGKTTQHYVMSVVGARDGVTFSELASGVPLGGDLDYLDDGTLTLAFGGRKAL